MSAVKHQPATPLPWRLIGDEESVELVGADYTSVNNADRGSFGDDFKRIAKDIGYERHAANAYPKLVEALRNACQAPVPPNEDYSSDELDAARTEGDALLRELGESS